MIMTLNRIQIMGGRTRGECIQGFGETGQLDGEVTYQKPGIWEVFQPETFTLSRRLKGVVNLTIVSEDKFFLKEFHFTKQEKAYARLSALTDGVTYGDSFVRTAGCLNRSATMFPLSSVIWTLEQMLLTVSSYAEGHLCSIIRYSCDSVMGRRRYYPSRIAGNIVRCDSRYRK